MTAGERSQDRTPEPEWLHAHVHEPNPEPPSADPAFTLLLPGAQEHIIAARDLARLPQCEVGDCYIVSTGHGTSGPFTFGGVRLADFVSAYLSPGARWRDLDVVSADGFGNRVAAHEIGAHEGDRPILLATAVDGRPMTRAQGLVRLIVPGERDDALRQVKWVSRIEIHSEPKGVELENWRTRARRTVLQAGDGRFLKVEYHTVELPDGQVIDDWPWLITPDFVNVVAETQDGKFICFRQTKYAVAGVSLAIAGGYLEPGEDPLAAAQRELLEETGYAAPDWTSLGTYAVDGNRGAGTAHLYLARGAASQQPVDADDLEEQEMVMLSRREMSDALRHGEFKVLPWATAVALAIARLQVGEVG